MQENMKSDNKSKTSVKISVIGSGVVGSATGMGFSAKGNRVLFHDIDKSKLISLGMKGFATTEVVEEAVKSSQITLVCVPTPTVDKKVDVSCLYAATKSIGEALSEASDFHVIVFRSTAPPTTTRMQLIPLLEKYSGLRAGDDFGVCMNPEFLREKTPLEDFLNPDRIIIGEL